VKRLALCLILILAACRHAAPPQSESQKPAGEWAVDPHDPGPDAPPEGRSLFDQLAPNPLPYPFEDLLAVLNRRIGGGVQPRRVLIPLGRSLQRSAGAPDFFRYPRAVAAYDTNSSRTFVKDRLYVGYHEKAGVIEIISYNEDAARFEFQLVENYREGTTPRLTNAPRRVCTACHQNHAPLFPVQLWDETNSNPRVFQLLSLQGREFYGYPISQSADVPYQIDLAVHRANELSVYQLLWRKAGPSTRALVLKAALRCRLSGKCQAPELAEPVAALWRANWPAGLRVPNPEIPNRNPLAILSREGPTDPQGATAFLAERQKNIDGPFEPAALREPLAIWQGTQEDAERWVHGLAGFFSDADAARLANRPLRDVPVDAKTFRRSEILRAAGL
jgi:hypothetical protein